MKQISGSIRFSFSIKELSFGTIRKILVSVLHSSTHSSPQIMASWYIAYRVNIAFCVAAQCIYATMQETELSTWIKSHKQFEVHMCLFVVESHELQIFSKCFNLISLFSDRACWYKHISKLHLLQNMFPQKIPSNSKSKSCGHCRVHKL
jgi:hypothetical protein